MNAYDECIEKERREYRRISDKRCRCKQVDLSENGRVGAILVTRRDKCPLLHEHRGTFYLICLDEIARLYPEEWKELHEPHKTSVQAA